MLFRSVPCPFESELEAVELTVEDLPVPDSAGRNPLVAALTSVSFFSGVQPRGSPTIVDARRNLEVVDGVHLPINGYFTTELLGIMERGASSFHESEELGKAARLCSSGFRGESGDFRPMFCEGGPVCSNPIHP